MGIRFTRGKKMVFGVFLAMTLGGCVSVRKIIEEVPPVVRLAPGALTPPFELGERLTYNVYYGFIRVGTATLVIEEVAQVCSRQTYHVVLTAKTTPTFSTIYRVDDRIETFIGEEEYIPWKFAKDLKEGDYRCDEETILDQEYHLGHYRSNRSGYTEDYEIPERCQDTLSTFYFLRLLSYSVGERFLVKVMADEKIWDVVFEVKERARRSVPGGGSYDTFVLASDADFDSGSLRKGSGSVWISTDERKLIVLIKTKLSFGHLTLALVKVDNIYQGSRAGKARGAAAGSLRSRGSLR
jgi:hypothetical protein